ncbi:UNVERIFIED_CONTAM: Nematode resistance protein-like HSPRO2 [Sesamum calycinum]|uniref:Nematode resistance protein-like HSPRO2 n=1 Tax=Sesamum calycinum TaxID=2727403 RepID=A0AAW2LRU1_9LAMI
MVDLDWKTKMVSSEIPNKSPRLANKLTISIPPPKIRLVELSAASDSACSAYEHYLRLPELKKLWSASEFPSWKSEGFSDRLSWALRLPSGLSRLCCLIRGRGPGDAGYDTDRGSDVGRRCFGEGEQLGGGVEDVGRYRGGEPSQRGEPAAAACHVAEFRRCCEEDPVLHRVSDAGCPYTLGLGEPNLSGKPSLNYDRICKPAELHALKKCPNDDDVGSKNFENRTLYSTHQILESWVRVGKELVARICDEIDARRYERAAGHCWTLEKVWTIINQIEDLHLLMDPDDFLRLKNQLMIRASPESELFCFRSRELVEITKSSKDLKHKVPAVLEVEVDPTGGPRIQDAAMELYRRKEESAKIHLLQAMQAVEVAVKRFYFCYKQLLAVVMGSLEAKGNVESGDLLSQIFLEPTYFPSLDAAKTFLGERWSHDSGRYSPERRRRNGDM